MKNIIIYREKASLLMALARGKAKGKTMSISKQVSGLCVSTALAGSMIVAAQAADNNDGSLLLEEITVTAQKREQSLQSVGVSVTALSGDQMRLLSLKNAEDLNLHVPGLQTGSFSGDKSVSFFTLRGVGQNDFSDHQETPTAIYVDGSYVSFPGATGLQMFDLERVEVLRGPQGTLYGRNATGGLVHFISRRPGQEPNGYINIQAGSYNMVRAEGAVGGPLSDAVRARIAGVHNRHDGYIENRLGKDAREDRSTSLRGIVEVDLSDELMATFIGRYNRVDHADGGVYQHKPSRTGEFGLGAVVDDVDFAGYRDTDGDVLAGAFNPLGFIDKESWNASATFEWQFSEAVKFTSITDYLDVQKSYMEDSDSSPTELLQFISGQDSYQFTQELRLDGTQERIRWTAGVYYLKVDGEYSSSIWSVWPLGDGTVAVADSRNRFTQETETFSAFGQIEYDLNEALTLTVGGRWYQDKKSIDLVSRCFGVPGYPQAADLSARDQWEPVITFENGVAVDNPGGASCIEFFYFPDDGVKQLNEHEIVSRARKDNEWAGKVQLDWRATEDILLYASVSRGTKGGGFNAPIDGLGDADPAVGQDKVPFDPEVLISYEVGLKSTLNDGRTRLNMAAFYYDYNDFQAFNFVGLTQFQFNADARIYGMEAELVTDLGNGFNLMAGISLMDSVVYDVPMPDTVTVRDQDLVLAPDFTANAVFVKTWQGDWGTVAAQIDGAYVDDQVFNTVNHPTVQADGYFLMNARIGYTNAGGEWEFAAYVKNLTDKRYKQYGFDVSGFGYSLDVYGPPRWYGVEANYAF